ncbi:hypothetical protein LFT46_09110 [Arthrobacter sp. FW306-07-I]|nr:hypothetical protein LFT46_09110 [Arthrobacter sp. FW306-07-I]
MSRGHAQHPSTSTSSLGQGVNKTGGSPKFGARYYNPTIGRFTQPDPSTHESNRYLYALACPTNNRDPLGLDTINELECMGSWTMAAGSVVVLAGLFLTTAGLGDILWGSFVMTVSVPLMFAACDESRWVP